jgi:hypothetical protein
MSTSPEKQVESWTLKGRTAGAPGPFEHLEINVVDGPEIPNGRSIKVVPADRVIPADSPFVLTGPEIHLLTAPEGSLAAAEEQGRLELLQRLSKLAETANV